MRVNILGNIAPLFRALKTKLTAKAFNIRQSFHRSKIALLYVIRKRKCGQIFFILCQPRTGSNLLYSYFNSVPMVLCDNEIISRKELYGLSLRAGDVTRLYRHILHSLHYKALPVRGAKICLYQLDEHGVSLDNFTGFFSKAHFFLIYRENILLQYLSHQIAFRSGEWVKTDCVETRRRIKVIFNLKEALAYRDEIIRRNKTIFENDSWNRKIVWISYEQLTRDPQACFDEHIFPKLGLLSSPIKTNYHKQNDVALEQMIENYASVRDQIAKHSFMQKY